MKSQSISIQKKVLQNLIYTIRGKQVMTNSDLVELLISFQIRKTAYSNLSYTPII